MSYSDDLARLMPNVELKGAGLPWVFILTLGPRPNRTDDETWSRASRAESYICPN